nr:unnamed protein product [Digitaria exilis]
MVHDGIHHVGSSAPEKQFLMSFTLTNLSWMGVKSSMKLRCRKSSNKAETSKNKDDYVDEDSVEPSLVEEDNDSGDDYTAGSK